VADVKIGVGTEGSQIEGSDVSLGNVAGGNVYNLYEDPKYKSRNRNDHLSARLENINARLMRVESIDLVIIQRIGEVEKVLGGSLGTSGLAQQLERLQAMMTAAKEERDEIRLAVAFIQQYQKEHPATSPWVWAFVIGSTVALLLSIILLFFSMG
jgi:hypothetical protein